MKDSTSKAPRKAKKHKQKFDPLRKSGTLKTRQDFIETDYIHGVKGEDGKMAIRPMTKEEIEWLSQYYQEAENVNFVKTEEIKVEHEKLRKLIRKFRPYKDIYGEEHPKVKSQREKLRFLREESNTLFVDDKMRKELYKQDNDRRNDVFNVSKQTGTLINFDIPEYDRFTSEALDSTDGEIVGLNQMFKVKTVRRKKS
jgi:hypothetical protein